MKHRSFATLAAALALGACAENPPVDWSGATVHAQALAPANSMIGEGCDGHHPSHGAVLGSHTRHVVAVRLNEIVGGAEVPFASVVAPADEGVVRMPAYGFAGRVGEVSCAGTALRTVVTGDAGQRWVEWELEVTPWPGSRLPADPWRARGTVRIDGEHGADTVAFNAGGRSYVARVSVNPGPGLRREQVRDAYLEVSRRVDKTYATPLPDEMPNRTLDDVVRETERSRPVGR